MLLKLGVLEVCTLWVLLVSTYITGDPLHSRAACTQPCNVNTHSRAHCSPGARLCEQWGHGCVNNGARLCASARLCRGSPLYISSQDRTVMIKSWWCHQMETFSTLLALCMGNSPVTCEFPSQRPVTQSFDVFFDLHLNKGLSKQ